MRGVRMYLCCAMHDFHVRLNDSQWFEWVCVARERGGNKGKKEKLARFEDIPAV